VPRSACAIPVAQALTNSVPQGVFAVRREKRREKRLFIEVLGIYEKEMRGRGKRLLTNYGSRPVTVFVNNRVLNKKSQAGKSYRQSYCNDAVLPPLLMSIL
jgi:hypothetical protein